MHKPYYLGDSTLTLQKQLADLARQFSASLTETNVPSKNATAKTKFIFAGITFVLGLLIGIAFVALGILNFKQPTSPTKATPTPLSPGGKILKMDSLPFQVFDYGQWQNLVAPKYFSYFYVVNDVSSEKGYKLEFSLPPQGDTAAGISFTFTESQNLAEYDFIELKATFLETDTRCDLYIRDITMNINAPFVTLGGNAPSDVEASLKGNTWKYRIPLKTYFKSVDWKAVKEIGFNAWRFEGKHTFTISEMNFVKP